LSGTLVGCWHSCFHRPSELHSRGVSLARRHHVAARGSTWQQSMERSKSNRSDPFGPGRNAAAGVEVCVLNSGNIRGAATYPHQFTWFDLRSKISFPTFVAVCRMPGSVLIAAVKRSRSHLPQPHGAFLQLDSQCKTLQVKDNTMKSACVPRPSPYPTRLSYPRATCHVSHATCHGVWN
jgi:hypothetical protein